VATFGVIEGSGIDGAAHPTWPGQGQPFAGETAPDGSWYAWRVSGANHRELGRGMTVHPDLAGVLRAIVELRDGLDRAVLSYITAPAGAHWTWRLVIDSQSIAMSSRTYFRQRECAYAAAAFMEAVRAAPIPTVAGRRHRAFQVNERRTPNDQGAYGLPAQTESQDPPLSVNLGRTPS
jgi:hypothetical protein